MRTKIRWLVMALGCLAVCSLPATAEIRPQSRSEAAIVVKGEVTNVRTTKRGLFDDYVTTLRIAEVIKGDMKPGGSLAVRTYQLVRTPPRGWVGPGGHGAPPPKGAMITAYVGGIKGKDGAYGGIYKDWFDLLPEGR